MSESNPLRTYVHDLVEIFRRGKHLPDVQKVGGYIVTPTAGFTRPSNTTQYAVGDVITGDAVLMEFKDCARVAQGTGLIQSAMLIDGSNETTKLAADLWLFAQPVDIEADNVKWTPKDSELLSLQAVVQWAAADAIQSDVTANIAGNVVNVQNNLARPFKCRDTLSLYGVMTARNTYTPVAVEPINVVLNILQD